MNRSRWVSVVLAALAMVAAGAVAWRWAGGYALAAVLLLFTATPEWIAHGRIATLDMSCAAFAFLAVAALWQYRRAGGTGWIAVAGLFAGAAFASKFSAAPIVLGMVLVVLGDLLPRRGENDGTRLTSRDLVAPAVFALALLAVVLISYGGDAARLIADLGRASERTADGHDAYFLGQVSKTGWRSYYPAAYALKTPIGTLALNAAAFLFFLVMAEVARRAKSLEVERHRVCRSRRGLRGLRAFSKVDIGVRFLLPLQPILILLSGVVVSKLARGKSGKGDRRRRARGVPFRVGSRVSARPFILQRSRRRTGERSALSERLQHRLGPGSPRTRAPSQRGRGAGRVVLGYFGPAPPESYGIDYQPPRRVFGSQNPDDALVEPVPDLLAASMTFQTGQYAPGLEWLLERTPVARAGWSIGLYDLSGDADGHRRLAAFYRSRGSEKTAAAHEARAAEIADNRH
ncbi:MAG: hypothetical protein M5R36_01485 [Deltaproteobacteria bacterium]|nr:hypothetical protein [Deltaproteobacteria bacterium]